MSAMDRVESATKKADVHCKNFLLQTFLTQSLRTLDSLRCLDSFMVPGDGCKCLSIFHVYLSAVPLASVPSGKCGGLA